MSGLQREYEEACRRYDRLSSAMERAKLAGQAVGAQLVEMMELELKLRNLKWALSKSV